MLARPPGNCFKYLAPNMASSKIARDGPSTASKPATPAEELLKEASERLRLATHHCHSACHQPQGSTRQRECWAACMQSASMTKAYDTLSARVLGEELDNLD